MVWNSSIFLLLPSESISLKVTPGLHHMSILGTEGVTIGEYRRAFVPYRVPSRGWISRTPLVGPVSSRPLREPDSL